MFRESSPRTKRSISSSASTFSSSREIFFREMMTFPSTAITSIYTRVPGRAYFTVLLRRLLSTRQASLPSAIMATDSSGWRNTGVSWAFSSLSANSPSAWFTDSTASSFVMSAVRFPVLALLISIRSSISFFKRWDCRLRTSR